MRRIVVTAILFTSGLAPSLAQESLKPVYRQVETPEGTREVRVQIGAPSSTGNSPERTENAVDTASFGPSRKLLTPQEALQEYISQTVVPHVFSRRKGQDFRGWTMEQPVAATYGFVRTAHDPFGAALKPVDWALRQQLGLPADQGLVVLSLQPGGPAEQVGLKPNDIVMAMGETPLTTEESWRAALSNLGEKSAPLNVIRQGERLSITVRARKSLSLAPVDEEKADAKPEYYIGIYTNPVDEVLRSHLGLRGDQVGLVVQGVMEDSPAAKAGLAAGDVLLAARDSSITSVDQLNDLIQVLRDTPTPFKIVRNRSEKSILITPVPRPPEEQEATEDALELWNVVPNLGERLSAHVVYQQGHPEVRIVDLGELKSMNGSLDARIANPAVISNADHTAMAVMQKLQEQVIQDLNRLIEIQSKEQANSTGKQIEALTRQVEALSKAVEELRNSVSRSTPVPAESP